MPYGHTGKLIFVDLSKSEVKVEQLPEKYYRMTLGGEGLGALILNERQPPKADPLGPDNYIGILSGLLTGCGVPSSSRTVVITKSPLTGTIGDANSGGAFAPELKKAGFDGLFIKGKSPKPVYLLITQDKVQLKDAAHLWGKDTKQTKKALIEEQKEPKLKVASIGPSGEKISLISSLILDDRAAARSGVGAVMGSKKLKAIACKGNHKIKVKDPHNLRRMNREFAHYLKTVDYFVIDVMRRLGSCGFMSIGYKAGIAPTKNWREAGEESFPNHEKVDGENVRKYMTKRHGCFACPICCGGTVKVKKGPYPVEARLPEYETITAFGSMVMNENIELIFKAQDICDRYGIDTISCGTAVSFAMECYEKGILTKEDLDGLEADWGNEKAILELTRLLVNRKGLGDKLADGVKKAAERIGKGSGAYAVHIGGQELPFHDFRYEAPSRGVTYLADPTPARHERCTGGQLLQLGMALGPYPELQPEKTDPNDLEGLGRLYAKGSKYYQAFSSCGLCAYTMGATSKLPLVEMIKAATGWEDFTVQELMEAGERSQALRQTFNLKEGVKPHNRSLHPRLKEPPSFKGPMKQTDQQYDWPVFRKAYFKGYDWDPETGLPQISRMKQLNLGKYALKTP